MWSLQRAQPDSRLSAGARRAPDRFWQSYDEVSGRRAANHQSVGKETDETAHIERVNDTLRQRLARFARKTRSASKSDA